MPESLYVQALNKVAADIAEFDLNGIVRHQLIPVRRLSWEDVRNVGGLTVRYTDQRVERQGPGTNLRDIYGYPCHVILVLGAERDLQPSTNAALRIRQELIRHFHYRRTMETLDFVDTEDPLPTVVSDGPRPPAEYADIKHNIYTWTVWAWFIEPRDAE